jgi:hypothetical protein
MSTRDDILASIRKNRPQATRPLPVEFLHDVLKVDAFPWAKFPGWRPLGCIRWPRWTIRSIRSRLRSWAQFRVDRSHWPPSLHDLFDWTSL